MILRHILKRKKSKRSSAGNAKPTVDPGEAVTAEDWEAFRDVESDDEYEAKEQRYLEKLQRSVCFNPSVEVCLVPSRSDMGPRAKDLFWRCDDYEQFKHEAICEIRAYWRFSGTISRDALAVLYQPEYDWPEDFFAPLAVRADEREDECFHCEYTAPPPPPVLPMRHVDSLSCFEPEWDAEMDTDCESLSDTLSLSSTRRPSTDNESDAESIASDCLENSI